MPRRLRYPTVELFMLALSMIVVKEVYDHEALGHMGLRAVVGGQQACCQEITKDF